MFKSASLKVVGETRLHCESCEQRVARVLGTLTGVQRVNAHANSQRIEVLFDPATLELATIVERLSMLGYTIETMENAAIPKGEQALLGQPK